MFRSYVMFVAFRWVNMSLVQLLSYQRLFVVQNFTIITIYMIYVDKTPKALLKTVRYRFAAHGLGVTPTEVSITPLSVR